MSLPTTANPSCASCRAPISGQFCAECGAPGGARRCNACQADLSPGAKFCHLCGATARPGPAPRNERLAWTVATALVLLSGVAIAYRVGRDNPEPVVPQMGNAGNASPTRTQPPDISKMGPRERFDRLFDRIAASQSSDTIGMFAPMALAAYQQLEHQDTDARFHAAIIHLIVGEFAQAKALADTIASADPKHLFPMLIRGEVAGQENDKTALAKSYRDFLGGYDAEMKFSRKEYLEHKAWLDDFKNKAQVAPK